MAVMWWIPCGGMDGRGFEAIIERCACNHTPVMSTTTETQPASEASETAARGLSRAHAALARELDAELEAAHGLQLSSYEVLANLAAADHHRLRMRDLAEQVMLSRSGLTRLVDRLAREGLIARECCPSDARGMFAVITPEGLALVRAARRTHQAASRRLLDDLFERSELERMATY